MRAASDRDGVRRPRISWKNLILAGLVLFGSLAYLHFAGRKFAWWKQAELAGEVVGKEACVRDTDAPVPEARALEKPVKHRFFLQIADDEGKVATHEVTLSVFRKARVGDHIEKKAGTYRVRRVPAPVTAPEQPST